MKLKLDSSISSDQDGAFLFGIFRTFRARGKRVLQVHPWRLLIVAGVLAAIGYTTAVSAAYYVRSQRPYNQITLADIALPWRWPGLSEKAGQTNLEHGKAEFENENYRGAMHYLRAGLARAPGDHDARMKLAQIYQGGGLSEMATNILMRGLDYGYPENEEYIQLLMIVLALRENYSGIADAAARLRAFPEIQENEERSRQLAKIQERSLKRERDFENLHRFAMGMREQFPEQLEYLDLEVLSLIKLGFINEALAKLEAYPLARKHSPQYWYLQLMLAIEIDDLEAVEDTARRMFAWPTRPFHLQAQLITEFEESRLLEHRDRFLDEYLEINHGNPQALTLILKLHDDDLSVEQTDAIIQRIRELDADPAPTLDLFAIKARLFSGQGNGARSMLESMLQDERIADVAENYDWMRKLVVVIDEKAQNDRKAFWELTRNKRLSAEAYVTSARALLVAEDEETALRVTENGLHYYPHNESLVALKNEARQAL